MILPLGITALRSCSFFRWRLICLKKKKLLKRRVLSLFDLQKKKTKKDINQFKKNIFVGAFYFFNFVNLACVIIYCECQNL